MLRLLIFALLAGCAKRSGSHPTSASPVTDEWDYAGGAAEDMPAKKSESSRSGASPGRAAGPMAPPPPPPPPPSVEAAPPKPVEPSEQPAEAQQERMIHYTGYARIRATKVHETLDAVAKMALDRGGRVEQLSGDTISVRVPVATFDASWKDVLGMGDVLDQSVSAEDVTDAFTEVDLRVHILKITRDRLVQLLARAETEDEKIALLHEIQSTTEQLDQLESSLRTLRGLADYSRITVEVVAREAVASGGTGGPSVAGMEWIAALSPFRRDIGADDHRVSVAVPEGMVSLMPHGAFVAESPEGVVVWTGRIDNDPRGSADFWVDAISGRLRGDFASATSKALGPWRCVELVDASEQPYTWDVCVQVDPVDRKLLLGEVYYPSEEAKKRYQPAVEGAFSGGAS
jgi:hypothetical protein